MSLPPFVPFAGSPGDLTDRRPRPKTDRDGIAAADPDAIDDRRQVSLMEIKIIDLPTIAVIGKEGLCTAGRNIVQQLWQEADAHFGEVAALGKKAPDGTYAAFWGAMSDESRSFRPWTHQFTRGLYLAGVETHIDAAAPEGWTKWVLPARKYIVVDVEPDRYGEIFDEVIQVTIPGKGMKLAGAVCDHTEPATGKSRLFFPVEPL